MMKSISWAAWFAYKSAAPQTEAIQGYWPDPGGHTR
jgi:hypothetical protein